MKTLKELSKYTLARYQAKAADDLRFRGVDQGAKIDHAISKGGDMRKTDPDIEKRSRKLDKRVIGIGKAGRKLAAGGYTGGVGPESPTGKMHNEEVEQIDEPYPQNASHDEIHRGRENAAKDGPRERHKDQRHRHRGGMNGQAHSRA